MFNNTSNNSWDVIRFEKSFSSILINYINRLDSIIYKLKVVKKWKYFGRTLEKSPELETLVGIGGSFFCPFGKATVRNLSS